MVTFPSQNPMTDKKVIPFVRYQIPAMILSALLIVVSLWMMKRNGINLGVDFTGGIKLVYQFTQNVSEEKIRELITPLNVGEAQVVRYGAERDLSYLIKLKYKEDRDVSAELSKAFSSGLGGISFQLLSEENVGPKVGGELRKKGLFAIFLAWILILIYIGIRFDFLFAPGAVVALIHDVTITMGFFTFLHKEFNLPILAALLTIIGYSINDTIVIYDRIRENIKKFPEKIPLSEIVDVSLTETLSRTIVTSLTVLFAVVVLFIMGGSVLHDFAFSLIVGVIAGSYSTLFIATPIYLLLVKFFPGRGIAKGQSR